MSTNLTNDNSKIYTENSKNNKYMNILYEIFIEFADVSSLDFSLYLKTNNICKIFKKVSKNDIEITLKKVQGNYNLSCKALTFEKFVLFVKNLAYRKDPEQFKENMRECTYKFIEEYICKFYNKNNEKFMKNGLKKYIDSIELNENIVNILLSIKNSLLQIYNNFFYIESYNIESKDLTISEDIKGIVNFCKNYKFVNINNKEIISIFQIIYELEYSIDIQALIQWNQIGKWFTFLKFVHFFVIISLYSLDKKNHILNVQSDYYKKDTENNELSNLMRMSNEEKLIFILNEISDKNKDKIYNKWGINLNPSKEKLNPNSLLILNKVEENNLKNKVSKKEKFVLKSNFFENFLEKKEKVYENNEDQETIKINNNDYSSIYPQLLELAKNIFNKYSKIYDKYKYNYLSLSDIYKFLIDFDIILLKNKGKSRKEMIKARMKNNIVNSYRRSSSALKSIEKLKNLYSIRNANITFSEKSTFGGSNFKGRNNNLLGNNNSVFSKYSKYSNYSNNKYDENNRNNNNSVDNKNLNYNINNLKYDNDNNNDNKEDNNNEELNTQENIPSNHFIALLKRILIQLNINPNENITGSNNVFFQTTFRAKNYSHINYKQIELLFLEICGIKNKKIIYIKHYSSRGNKSGFNNFLWRNGMEEEKQVINHLNFPLFIRFLNELSKLMNFPNINSFMEYLLSKDKYNLRENNERKYIKLLCNYIENNMNLLKILVVFKPVLYKYYQNYTEKYKEYICDELTFDTYLKLLFDFDIFPEFISMTKLRSIFEVLSTSNKSRQNCQKYMNFPLFLLSLSTISFIICTGFSNYVPEQKLLFLFKLISNSEKLLSNLKKNEGYTFVKNKEFRDKINDIYDIFPEIFNKNVPEYMKYLDDFKEI